VSEDTRKIKIILETDIRQTEGKLEKLEARFRKLPEVLNEVSRRMGRASLAGTLDRIQARLGGPSSLLSPRNTLPSISSTNPLLERLTRISSVSSRLERSIRSFTNPAQFQAMEKALAGVERIMRSMLRLSNAIRQGVSAGGGFHTARNITPSRPLISHTTPNRQYSRAEYINAAIGMGISPQEAKKLSDEIAFYNRTGVSIGRPQHRPSPSRQTPLMIGFSGMPPVAPRLMIPHRREVSLPAVRMNRGGFGRLGAIMKEETLIDTPYTQKYVTGDRVSERQARAIIDKVHRFLANKFNITSPPPKLTWENRLLYGLTDAWHEPGNIHVAPTISTAGRLGRALGRRRLRANSSTVLHEYAHELQWILNTYGAYQRRKGVPADTDPNVVGHRSDFYQILRWVIHAARKTNAVKAPYAWAMEYPQLTYWAHRDKLLTGDQIEYFNTAQRLETERGSRKSPPLGGVAAGSRRGQRILAERAQRIPVTGSNQLTDARYTLRIPEEYSGERLNRQGAEELIEKMTKATGWSRIDEPILTWNSSPTGSRASYGGGRIHVKPYLGAKATKGRTHIEKSLLVHEFAHHLQALNKDPGHIYMQKKAAEWGLFGPDAKMIGGPPRTSTAERRDEINRNTHRLDFFDNLLSAIKASGLTEYPWEKDYSHLAYWAYREGLMSQAQIDKFNKKQEYAKNFLGKKNAHPLGWIDPRSRRGKRENFLKEYIFGPFGEDQKSAFSMRGAGELKPFFELGYAQKERERRRVVPPLDPSRALVPIPRLMAQPIQSDVNFTLGKSSETLSRIFGVWEPQSNKTPAISFLRIKTKRYKAYKEAREREYEEERARRNLPALYGQNFIMAGTGPTIIPQIPRRGVGSAYDPMLLPALLGQGFVTGAAGPTLSQVPMTGSWKPKDFIRNWVQRYRGLLHGEAEARIPALYGQNFAMAGTGPTLSQAPITGTWRPSSMLRGWGERFRGILRGNMQNPNDPIMLPDIYGQNFELAGTSPGQVVGPLGWIRGIHRRRRERREEIERQRMARDGSGGGSGFTPYEEPPRRRRPLLLEYGASGYRRAEGTWDHEGEWEHPWERGRGTEREQRRRDRSDRRARRARDTRSPIDGLDKAVRDADTVRGGIADSLSQVRHQLINLFVIWRSIRGIVRAFASITKIASDFEQKRLAVAETLTVAGNITAGGRTAPRTVKETGIGLKIYDQVRSAYTQSTVAMKTLVKDSIALGLPVSHVTQAFAVTAGSARSAGISLKDSIPIIENLTVLAQRLQVPFNVLARDVRDIFTGLNVGRTILGNVLGLTESSIREQTRKGNLGPYLNELLKGIYITLEDNVHTYQGLLNSLLSTYQSIIYLTTESAMESLKSGIKSIRGELAAITKSPERMLNLENTFLTLAEIIKGAWRAATGLLIVIQKIAEMDIPGIGGLPNMVASGTGLVLGGTIGSIIGGILAPFTGGISIGIGGAIGSIIGGGTGYGVSKDIQRRLSEKSRANERIFREPDILPEKQVKLEADEKLRGKATRPGFTITPYGDVTPELTNPFFGNDDIKQGATYQKALYAFQRIRFLSAQFLPEKQEAEAAKGRTFGGRFLSSEQAEAAAQNSREAKRQLIVEQAELKSILDDTRDQAVALNNLTLKKMSLRIAKIFERSMLGATGLVPYSLEILHGELKKRFEMRSADNYLDQQRANRLRAEGDLLAAQNEILIARLRIQKELKAVEDKRLQLLTQIKIIGIQSQIVPIERAIIGDQGATTDLRALQQKKERELEALRIDSLPRTPRLVEKRAVEEEISDIIGHRHILERRNDDRKIEIATKERDAAQVAVDGAKTTVSLVQQRLDITRQIYALEANSLAKQIEIADKEIAVREDAARIAKEAFDYTTQAVTEKKGIEAKIAVDKGLPSSEVQKAIKSATLPFVIEQKRAEGVMLDKEGEVLQARARRAALLAALETSKGRLSLETASDNTDKLEAELAQKRSELDLAKKEVGIAQASEEKKAAEWQRIDELERQILKIRELRGEFISLGDVLNNQVGTAIEGLASGTQNLGDVFQSAFKSTALDIFRQSLDYTLKEKIGWDKKIEKNFLEWLPGITKQGADKAGENIGKIFKGDFSGGFGGLFDQIFGGSSSGAGAATPTPSSPQQGIGTVMAPVNTNMDISDLIRMPSLGESQPASNLINQFVGGQDSGGFLGNILGDKFGGFGGKISGGITGLLGKFTGTGIGKAIAGTKIGGGIFKLLGIGAGNTSGLLQGFGLTDKIGAGISAIAGKVGLGGILGSLTGSGSAVAAGAIPATQAASYGMSVAGGAVTSAIPAGVAAGTAGTAGATTAATTSAAAGVSTVSGAVPVVGWVVAALMSIYQAIEASKVLKKMRNAPFQTEESIRRAAMKAGPMGFLNEPIGRLPEPLVALLDPNQFIMKLAGMFKPKMTEHFLGKWFGDFFGNVGLPTMTSGGKGRINTRLFGMEGGPWYPVNPAIQSAITPRARELGAIFGRTFPAGRSPGLGAYSPNQAVNALVNNFTALGLSAEDSVEYLNKMAPQFLPYFGKKKGGEFTIESALLGARKNQSMGGRRQVDPAIFSTSGSLDYMRGIATQAIMALNKVPKAADEAQLSLVAVANDGMIHFQKLERAIEKVNETFQSFGEYFQTVIKTGDMSTAGQRLGETFVDGITKSINERLMSKDSVFGKRITEVGVMFADVAELFAAGKSQQATKMLIQASNIAVEAQRDLNRIAAPIYPAISSLGSMFGVGTGFIDQGNVKFQERAQTPSYVRISGPRNAPRVMVMDGQETVRAPEQEDKLLKAIDDLNTSIGNGSNINVYVNIDGKNIPAKVSKVERSGMPRVRTRAGVQ